MGMAKKVEIEEIADIQISDPRGTDKKSSVKVYKVPSPKGSGEDYVLGIHLPLVPYLNSEEKAKRLYDAAYKKIDEYNRQRTASEPEPFSEEWVKKNQ